MAQPAGDLDAQLEQAHRDLEQAVMDTLGARKGLLDPARKQELYEKIWRLRVRAAELERDRIGRQLTEVRHAADRAATRMDHEEYLAASRKLAGLRIRYLNAADLLEKLRADGPASSARLFGG
ncbi:hypothetical protein Rxyl_1004 [Rubrobacter xylanophilus DSM 9941]|uniref:Uncharacterized protein n=1 Tax=Rubrobacter xylanophilus (strain DSM 9941 / JCM 11954 / NBRC 16129 / PRD-1) TaxID=266117 RepID=Q1AXA8_RUBXD|nr:hypothetical protein [Rubrobacter xylanophilus]ABG03970.1 hypothetical protein Rxyl_1004 [Rubrobacter xylanophilus DSM 9941]